MGRPVVHFEIIGKDAKQLQGYYAQLFEWEVDTSNAMGYGLVSGAGIGGGIWGGDMSDHVTFYVEVPDVEAALAQAESLGGTRVMGPHTMEEQNLTLGQFKDPEGHLIGLLQAAS